MTERAPNPQPNVIEIEHGGQAYTGCYTVDSEMIHVYYGSQTKTTQLGGSEQTPQTLASIILRELVEADLKGK